MPVQVPDQQRTRAALPSGPPGRRQAPASGVSVAKASASPSARLRAESGGTCAWGGRTAIGERNVADAQHVVAQRGGNDVGDGAGRRVDGEDCAQEARALDPPAEDDPVATEDERARAAAKSRTGSGPRPEGPARARPSARPSTPIASPAPTTVIRSACRPTAMEKRTSASSRKASGLAASVSTAKSEKGRGPAGSGSGQIASNASAAPSTNGNAAVRTVQAQTTANERVDQRASAPHCRSADDGEDERRRRYRRHGEELDSREQRGEGVVKQAVGDEAVAPTCQKLFQSAKPWRMKIAR